MVKCHSQPKRIQSQSSSDSPTYMDAAYPEINSSLRTLPSSSLFISMRVLSMDGDADPRSYEIFLASTLGGINSIVSMTFIIITLNYLEHLTFPREKLRSLGLGFHFWFGTILVSDFPRVNLTGHQTVLG